MEAFFSFGFYALKCKISVPLKVTMRGDGDAFWMIMMVVVMVMVITSTRPANHFEALLSTVYEFTISSASCKANGKCSCPRGGELRASPYICGAIDWDC